MKQVDEAAAKAVQENPLESDPWYAPTSRLKGKIDWDGVEHITSREVLDALGVPVAAKRSALYRRLNKVMQCHGWSPIRIRVHSGGGANISDRVRGYERKSGKLPHAISEDHPGKVDTSTPYVMTKVVGRLEMDSRWTLARSVRALLAERDRLREQLEARPA
jgi:hypothetical protein